MAKMRIEYEFDVYEEKDAIRTVVNSSETRRVLWDLDARLRNDLKNRDDDWLTEEVTDYLQTLRDLIWESGVFRDE